MELPLNPGSNTIMSNKSWFDLEVNWDPFYRNLSLKATANQVIHDYISCLLKSTRTVPFQAHTEKNACDTDFKK